ncbi:hypothetical protein [Anabaena sp. FACHB-1237]|nr:hypothetical protein [Anabaena sp. FACHB-1237]
MKTADAENSRDLLELLLELVERMLIYKFSSICRGLAILNPYL